MAKKEMDLEDKIGLAWLFGWPIYAIGLMLVINLLTSISHWVDKLDPELDEEKAQEWTLAHEAQIVAEDARLEELRSEVTNLMYRKNFYEAKILVEQLRWNSALENPWVRRDPYSKKWSSARSDMKSQIRLREKDATSMGFTSEEITTSTSSGPTTPASQQQDPCEIAKLELVRASSVEELELANMKVEVACQ